jgi:hypothetical protein
MCGSFVWGRATIRAGRLVSRCRVVARIEASPLVVVPVAGRVELLSRTVRMAQVLQTQSRFVGLFLEQGRVVVVCVAEDVSQEPGVWFGGIGGARAGSEGISDAVVEGLAVMESTFCSSARRDRTTTKTQPWRLA